jgi:hypothetical protein
MASIQDKKLGALQVMLLSWLFPGFGFFYHGMKRRGIFFFIVLEVTFLVGAAMQASILKPEYNYYREGFNLVAILTSFTQMFNGRLGLISLMPDLLQSHFHILPYNETSSWFDLGSFYMLVSGGMNYFVLVNTYDYFYGRKRERLLATAEAGS